MLSCCEVKSDGREIREPTDEELWLGLIGIFESGDPQFAELHDEIYSQGD